MRQNSKRDLIFLLLFQCSCAWVECPPARAAEGEADARSIPAAEVLAGVRTFFAQSACADGSFRPATDPNYPGLSDSAYSDLAPVTYAVVLHKTFGWKLPREDATREFLLARQQNDGAFINVRGTADPRSAQARMYNTTQGLVALHALGMKPKHDPLPVFDAVLKGDYNSLPAYMTSFFPLAYQASGRAFPAAADRRIRALMVPAEDGYLHEHVAATFHMVHYYRLVNEPQPKRDLILERVLHDQKPDGSWLLNQPARDRHATFDAVFVLRHLGGD